MIKAINNNSMSQKRGCLATPTTRKSTTRPVIGSARRGKRRERPSVRCADWLRAALSCQLIGWGGGGKDGGRWGAAAAGPWGTRSSGCRRLRLAEHTEEANAQVLLWGPGWGGSIASWAPPALGRQSSAARLQVSLMWFHHEGSLRCPGPSLLLLRAKLTGSWARLSESSSLNGVGNWGGLSFWKERLDINSCQRSAFAGIAFSYWEARWWSWIVPCIGAFLMYMLNY